MKKLLLTLGTSASIVAPLATVIACGSEGPTTTPENGTGGADSGSGWVEGDLTRNLEINGEAFNTSYDQFIMMEDYYNDGKLWSGNNKTGSLNTDGYSELVRGVEWSWDQGVAQMGDGDSVVLVYDNDDTDGIHPGNFDETVGFVDTSMAASDTISAINTKMGNGISAINVGNVTLPRFKDGKLLPYFGAQSNHLDPNLTFQGALKIIEQQLDGEQLTAVLEYYGYKNEKDSNGDFVKGDGNGASTNFLPFVAEEGLLTYERIARNAYKITYNNSNNEFGLPGAQLAFIEPKDGEDNVFETAEWGKFSFGSNSWDVYESGGDNFTDYSFTARKDVYLNA